MKANYNFSKARRGAVIPPSGNKMRITIRLDREIIDQFKLRAESQGGGNYQTMLNDALRSYLEQQEQSLEKIIRKVFREELRKAS
jgi:uncharacterized protein (DUF4415 family)